MAFDLNRRQFITRSALVLAAPAIVPYASLMPMSRSPLTDIYRYYTSVNFTVKHLEPNDFVTAIWIGKPDGNFLLYQRDSKSDA